MELIKYQSNSIIVDYAHTPDSLEKIITTVKQTTKNNVYAVFGCTGERDRMKRPIMFDIATTLCDKIIITIDDPHNEAPRQIVDDMIKDAKKDNYEIILDRKKAIEKGISLLKEKDILLILGKGHEEIIIFKNERIPFNDKKVVLEILKETEKIEI